MRLVGLVVLATALLTLASPTQAHNELVEASPANGATLKHLPDHGTLVFAEEASPQDLTIMAGGSALPVHQDPTQPRILTFDLGSVKPAKTVLLTWKVVDSHDGHESSGVLKLHVRGAGNEEAARSTHQATAEPRVIGLVSVAARVLGYLAMAVFVGGFLFLSLLWPAGARERRTHAVLGAAVMAGILAAVAAEWVVLWRSGSGFGQALTEDVGRASTAMVLLWVLAGVIVVAVAQRGEEVVRHLPMRIGALVVAAGLIRTTGINSHATQSAQPLWGIAADFIHLSAVSAWVGGLTMVCVCLLPRRSPAELEQVLPNFSKVALISVLLIVSSGLILFWQIIGSVDGFWETHYARVLLVKMSLFVLVLVAAMKSKHWVENRLAQAVESRRHHHARSFAASVAAETILVAAVLGAASVLVTSSPSV